MKQALRNFLLFFVLSALFVCCGSDDDDNITDDDDNKPESELKLSIDNKGFQWIEDVDLEFDILSGNGGYTVTVENEEIAKATIEDTTVYVNFICNGYTKITISDATERSIELSFSVYNPTLIPHSYIFFMEKGKTAYLEDLSLFGSGSGYKIENVKGVSANLSIEDNKLTLEAVEHGNTYCDIVDGRGTKMPFEAIVVAIHELTTNTLNITMKKDQRSSIKCMWGKGWQITSSGSLCESVMIKSQKPDGYDILQVDSSADIIGDEMISLKDKDGNIAVVNISIR